MPEHDFGAPGIFPATGSSFEECTSEPTTSERGKGWGDPLRPNSPRPI
jgi:hypothetical protein